MFDSTRQPSAAGIRSKLILLHTSGIAAVTHVIAA